MVTAMPYWAIFDSSNQPIIDPLTKRPIAIYVTSFSFTLNLKDVDKAEIKIQTPNADLPSLPSLQYGKVLKLQWGWTTPAGIQPSNVRSTTIKEHSIKWTATGIELIIRCEDAAAMAKTQNPRHKHNDGKDFKAFIKDQLEGRLPAVSIIDYQTHSQPYEVVAQKLEE